MKRLPCRHSLTYLFEFLRMKSDFILAKVSLIWEWGLTDFLLYGRYLPQIEWGKSAIQYILIAQNILIKIYSEHLENV